MSNISSVSNPNPMYPASQNSMGQSFTDFKAIGTALQSGDLTSAQSALATFQQSLPGGAQGSSTSPFGQNSQANKDYQALSTALQSGDAAGANKAYASLQSDLKAAHKGHHHHRSSGASSATPAAGSNPSSTSGSYIGNVNVTA